MLWLPIEFAQLLREGAGRGIALTAYNPGISFYGAVADDAVLSITYLK
jgi:hypothetical protein